MNLLELSQETNGLADAAFLRRFPDPALVFVNSFASRDDEPRVDTPSGGIKLSRTATLKTTDAFPVPDLSLLEGGGQGSPVMSKDASAVVTFLAKTARNPFGSMITVGRAGNNDVVIPDPSVSKVHAYFTRLGASWKITDQRATNGTFVDEVRIPAGGALQLADGARIGFGPDVRARFYTPVGLFGFLALFRAGISV